MDDPAKRLHTRRIAILTVKEAADYVKLSQSTIRSLCHIDAGDPDRIPHTRIGNSIRIPYWPLLLWLFQRSGGELPPVGPSKPPRRRAYHADAQTSPDCG